MKSVMLERNPDTKAISKNGETYLLITASPFLN